MKENLRCDIIDHLKSQFTKIIENKTLKYKNEIKELIPISNDA